jgi:protocatechuate 3,4-dioxygenase beta subunit
MPQPRFGITSFGATKSWRECFRSQTGAGPLSNSKKGKPMRWYHNLLSAAMLVSSTACSAETSGGTEMAAAADQAPRQLRTIPGCEGCEAAWERQPDTLASSINLSKADEPGEPLLLRGTIYKPDGKTSAPGIVLYVYHTNNAGVYGNGSNESEWGRRHGRLRGWLRTKADGRYEVHTIKPGRYPDRSDPAHIHLTVWEQGKDPYWIDEVVFAGEPGVDAAYRAERQNRGGSGIVQLKRQPNGRYFAERKIVLIR